jgi:hypothetical protein
LRTGRIGPHHGRIVSRCRPRSVLALCLVAFAALALPLAGRADDGGGGGGGGGDRADVRVERSCTARSTVRLRVRSEDSGMLRVDLDVRTPRPGTRWAVSVVHERRLAWSATRRTSTSSGSFSVRVTTPDWPGHDTLVARAVGPRGEVCRVTLTVDGD